MIIGLFGDLRSGKTLTAVKELYNFYLKGYKIYSNIHLNFDYSHITLKELENIVKTGKNPFIEDSVLFIDEFHIMIDSRRSMAKKSLILSYLVLMSGKLSSNDSKNINTDRESFGLIWLYTTQYPSSVDGRVRKSTALCGFCEKHNLNGKKVIKVDWHKIINGEEHIKTEIFYAHHYYRLYDTKEIVKIEKSNYDEEE